LKHPHGRAHPAQLTTVPAQTAPPSTTTAAPPWLALEHTPPWLPGGHAQTIWAALAARRWHDAPPRWQRERWTTPDGDFVDVDWLLTSISSATDTRPASTAPAPTDPDDAGAATPPDNRPLLVLFHGLEGSSSSQYAQAFADQAARLGWSYVVPHFRGCSGELNLAPRAYHSGDFAEIGWMLARLRARHAGPLHAVGISLGGNALLRWAEETGDAASQVVSSVASVCSPIDLASSGQAIGAGLCRWIYTPMFLRSMKPKALAKLVQYPGLFDRERLLGARTLYEFDQIFTAPLHGFASTEDYWARASAAPHLDAIRVPTVVLNAVNDPFVPASHLPPPGPRGPWVELWRPARGGHCGFPRGAFPADVLGLPEQLTAWMHQLA
jgi:predicted alpha/beta-fold hydrolase